IATNLSNALRRIRLLDEKRYVWSDAFFINQHNGEEKAIQVCHMLAIYQKASRVIVWVGE
ncbi:hypothetical protein K432DRAFT_282327, partial [Lepidopterella palustris CBS 459.81]